MVYNTYKNCDLGDGLLWIIIVLAILQYMVLLKYVHPQCGYGISIAVLSQNEGSIESPRDMSQFIRPEMGSFLIRRCFKKTSRGSHDGELKISAYSWWFGTFLILLFHILGMSSSQLTNSIIFQWGRLNHQPDYYSQSLH